MALIYLFSQSRNLRLKQANRVHLLVHFVLALYQLLELRIFVLSQGLVPVRFQLSDLVLLLAQLALYFLQLIP